MQQFLLGICVILMPSVLFVAWLVWQATAPRHGSSLMSAADMLDRD
jgi:hypothetical protein